MDIATISVGIAAVRTGIDTIKTAVGLMREAKDMLPSGDQKDKAGIALENAANKLAEGEAAVADAFGYTLCRCAFPPTPRLLVGYIPIHHLSGPDKAQVLSRQAKAGGDLTGSVPVHECPKCGNTDAPSYDKFQRTVPKSPAT